MLEDALSSGFEGTVLISFEDFAFQIGEELNFAGVLVDVFTVSCANRFSVVYSEQLNVFLLW